MSTFRYGDGTKYGAAGVTYGAHTVTRTLTWGILVDWDEDGSYTGENEANGRLLSLQLREGREFVLNSSSDGFVHINEGELVIDLKNEDGRYDPYYPSSELAGYLYRNQKIQALLIDETTGTSYYAFTGYIKDIRPSYGAVDTATIYADGAMIKLSKSIKSSGVYSSVSFNDQIEAALTAAGWTGGTDIDDTVTDTMVYHWFRGNHAITEINDLADAAFGMFWVDEEGTATYRSRISSDISTQTITEADIDYGYDIQAPAPRDVIKNKVKVYARARTLNTDVEIWRIVDRPLISGTGSPIWASFSYNGQDAPATAVTSPVSTTDYTANDNVNGSGTDRTANFSFSTTAFSNAAKLIPTNAGSAAYITLLKLRGNIITADEYTYAEAEDSDSIETYEEREYTVKTDWLQDLNSAQEYADTLVLKFSAPKVYPRFKFKRSAIGKQFTTPLMNLLTINFASRGITGEFRIGYIDRSWSINEPNVIDTVVYCEPNLTVAASTEWIFPMTFPTIFQ